MKDRSGSQRRRSSKVTDFSLVDRSYSRESDVHFVVIRYDKVEDDDSFEGQDTFEAKNSTMTANEVRSADWLKEPFSNGGVTCVCGSKHHFAIKPSHETACVSAQGRANQQRRE